jgi:hypothetical protein
MNHIDGKVERNTKMMGGSKAKRREGVRLAKLYRVEKSRNKAE